MKKILFIAALFLAQYSFAQTPTPTDVQFPTINHQFGKIKKGVPVTYLFSFKNVSEKPVVIEFANAECGCTTPEYPQTPITKGQSNTIKVTYNAATEGVFKKNVNVKFANTKLPYVLTIEGEVLPEKASTTPKK
jgi:hypothetical protein